MNDDPTPASLTAAGPGLFYRRAFALGAIAVLGLLLYRIVEPFLQPVAWAAIFALLMQPAQLRATRLLRGSPNVAALLLTLAVLLLFIGPLTALAVAFVSQAQELTEQLAGVAQRLRRQDMTEIMSSPTLRDLFSWVEVQLSISTVQIQDWALAGVRKLLENLATLGGTAFFGAIGTVLSFTVMMFILFFLLRDGRAIVRGTADFIPLSDERKHQLAVRMAQVTRAVVLGTVLTAAIQGTLLGIGFAIAGLPAPVVFGVVGAVLSVVPFGGTALVWVPASAFLLLTGDIGYGLFLSAWGVLVVSTVDNFLRPLFISGQSEVPTLAVFIGVLGGLVAFGLIGLFLGPVVIALALTLLKFAAEQKAAAAPPAR
jgi:predicted PurR-regulated permease PerM